METAWQRALYDEDLILSVSVTLHRKFVIYVVTQIQWKKLVLKRGGIIREQEQAVITIKFIVAVIMNLQKKLKNGLTIWDMAILFIF